MSTPILPFAPWESGTNQNSIPANDNALRSQILNGLVISDSTDAQPGSPSAGDIYIMTGSASGTQWSTFDEFDLAIYDGEGTWHAYAPVEGICVNIAGALNQWDGSGYVAVTTGGGVGAPVVTESGTSLAATPGNAGNYTRFTAAGAKTYTFDDAETYQVGAEYHGRNVGAADLTIAVAGSMAVNPPAGGTLVIPQHGTFTVKIVASGEADLFGQTVPV